jgi:hypothetical protein
MLKLGYFIYHFDGTLMIYVIYPKPSELGQEGVNAVTLNNVK